MDLTVHVLHVDDDDAFLDLTAEMLERTRRDIVVRSESDPTTVLDRLASEQFDCIVSDFEMPGWTGLELCRRVRNTDHDLPFFLFTNRSGEDIVPEALDAGVTDYIHKETGVHHYRLLATRITYVVTLHRAIQLLEQVDELPVQFSQITEFSSDNSTPDDSDATIARE